MHDAGLYSTLHRDTAQGEWRRRNSPLRNARASRVCPARGQREIFAQY